MDNSNTTASINTSKSPTTPKFITAASQTTFDIGDVVLCPSLSNSPFALTDDPTGKRDLLALTHDGSYFYYDDKGYFVSARDTETGDYQPSLYHNTPANQQAINTLYGNTSANQSSQRQVINTNSADEIVLLKSFKLSNNTSEVHGAAEVLDDISSLLGLIYRGEIRQENTRSLARLTQIAAETWSEILYTQVEKMNEILALTNFNKVGE